MARGPLLIVSGPSGAGKSTLIRDLLELKEFPLHLSVSATTREPRERNGSHEEDGVDYHFWDKDQFQAKLDGDTFLEWAKVHTNYYGTLRSEVDPNRAQGIGVILDIDVQGAESVREKYPNDHVSIFILPESMEVLEDRLRGRGTESEASIQTRLANAKLEIEEANRYDEQIVNQDRDKALDELRTIVKQAFEQA